MYITPHKCVCLSINRYLHTYDVYEGLGGLCIACTASLYVDSSVSGITLVELQNLFVTYTYTVSLCVCVRV